MIELSIGLVGMGLGSLLVHLYWYVKDRKRDTFYSNFIIKNSLDKELRDLASRCSEGSREQEDKENSDLYGDWYD